MVTFNEVPQRFGHGPFYTRHKNPRREKWAKIAVLTGIYLRQSEVTPFSHMDLARDAPYQLPYPCLGARLIELF